MAVGTGAAGGDGGGGAGEGAGELVVEVAPDWTFLPAGLSPQAAPPPPEPLTLEDMIAKAHELCRVCRSAPTHVLTHRCTRVRARA